MQILTRDQRVINTAVLFLAYMVKFPDKKFEDIVEIYDQLPQTEKDQLRETFTSLDDILSKEE